MTWTDKVSRLSPSDWKRLNLLMGRMLIEAAGSGKVGLNADLAGNMLTPHYVAAALDAAGVPVEEGRLVVN